MENEMYDNARMSITTVIGCRVQCAFCPQVLLMDRYEEKNNVGKITWGEPIMMTFETFKICIDKIPTNVPIYFAAFAEPWLNPECTKMMLYAYQKGHRIGVYTTLVGMKTEDVDQFKHIPFEVFDIHLPDVQKYAKIAITNQFLEVLERLSQEIPNVTYMSMEDVPTQIEQIIGKNKLQDSFMHNRAGNNELGHKTPKKYGPLLCGLASKNGVNLLNQNELLPNGDVALCCMDYGLDHILGNLVTSNYEDLFKSEEFHRVQQKLAAQDSDIMCRKCICSVKAKELRPHDNALTKLYFCKICKNFFDSRDVGGYAKDDGFAICEDCGKSLVQIRKQGKTSFRSMEIS